MCDLKIVCNGSGIGKTKFGKEENPDKIRTCSLCKKRMCWSCVCIASIGLVSFQPNTTCTKCTMGIPIIETIN